MLRTKYRKYFELEFLFSVNCINGFFPLVLVLWGFCLIFSFFGGGGGSLPFEIQTVSIAPWRRAALWNLDLPPPHFSPGSIAKDDFFKQRVEGRGWGCFTDAPGDPSLYAQVVYEEVSPKSAAALKRWERQRWCQQCQGAKRGPLAPINSPSVVM